MIGFLLKKNFFDGWDNLFSIVILNFLVMTISFAGFYGFFATNAIVYISLPILIITIILQFILLFAIGFSTYRMSLNKSFSIKKLFKGFGKSWIDAILFAILTITLIFVSFLTLNYYLAIGTKASMAVFVILFWVYFMTLLSLQWFIPIKCQLGGSFVKCLKKSFIIFFDNPGFSFFMLLYSTGLAILSVIPVFMIPGISGIIIAYNNALRLRLYKYDWLREQKKQGKENLKPKIPWETILAEEKEKLGYRSLRNLIFPWKE